MADPKAETTKPVAVDDVEKDENGKPIKKESIVSGLIGAFSGRKKPIDQSNATVGARG